MPMLPKQPLVCIQGLGFVGLAMATVVANSFDNKGVPLYQVIGVDLPENQDRINQINQGKLPFKSEDASFPQELKRAVLENKNLSATADESCYAQAAVVIVDVPLHIEKLSDDYSQHRLWQEPFEKAIHTLGQKMKPDCLVLVETTMPPGFCSRVVKPILDEHFKQRRIKTSPLIAHSYERVMPGKEYLNSIRNFYRTFSGIDDRSAQRAREFLSSIINVAAFPLKEENDTEASELAKVLENSYRAVNIALIYEWTLLAEKSGVNLFSVIKGIRQRKTHANIMEPGFGVGGYCLTKDSLLALWSASNYFGSDYGLPFSKSALEVNDKMPLHTLDLICQESDVAGKKVAILGVSYRQDIGDTRFSPTEIFYRALVKAGAKAYVHDPYIERWPECPEAGFVNFDGDLKEADIIVLAARHKLYLEVPKKRLVEISKTGSLWVDAFNILDDDKIAHLLKNDRNVIGVGKGHIRKMKEELQCQRS